MPLASNPNKEMLNSYWHTSVNADGETVQTGVKHVYIVKFALYLGFFLLVLFLAGCAGKKPNGGLYREQAPVFDIASFFEGEVKAWGIVQNRKRDIVQRFTVDIIGTREGEKLVLDETFNYSFGNGPATRVWELVRSDDGTWMGTAGDISGEARGAEFGNAFNWRYQMSVPISESGRRAKVLLDDWMWAFDENTIVNRSYIKKFGLTFAEVTLFMQKQN